MPLMRIPTALLGETGEGYFTRIWRNRFFWAGGGLALAWCLLRGWGFYSTSLPSLEINVPLRAYFGQEWGSMWDAVNLRVFVVILSLAVFMETNVLLSLLIGFFGFRFLFFLASLGGIVSDPQFVTTGYRLEQMTASFLVYGLTLAVLAWRHWGSVLRGALGRGPDTGADEPLTYRWSLGLLVAVFVGMAAWALWTGVSVGGALVFLLALLVVGFVSARLRAECGIPYGYFTPPNAALFVLMLGGIATFGHEFVLFGFITSFFITVSVFFLIPGMQLEFMQLGRRYHLRPSHVAVFSLIAVLGGMLIGGWVFLSNAYALGGRSLPYQWAFDAKAFFLADFNQQLVQLDRNGASAGAQIAAFWERPTTLGYLYGGIGVAVLTVTRQIFAGFWFHPVGFLLGPSYMMETIWGSVLLAWFLRVIVLKAGGAQTVRNALQPFFAGAFLGGVAAFLFWTGVGAWLRGQGIESIYVAIP